MAFDFKIEKDVEIPTVVRGGGGRSLGFPFDGMKPGAGEGTKGDRIFVPRKFWIDEAELTDEHIDGKKGPADLKDRIRRSFYGWRDKDAARENLTLVLVDKYDANKKYEGVHVQLTKTDAGLVDKSKAAAVEDKKKAEAEAAKKNKKAA